MDALKSEGINFLGRLALFLAALAIYSLFGVLQARASEVTCFKAERVVACTEYASLNGHKAKRERRNKRYTAPPARAMDASGNYASVIGGRPAGCPHAYCGCGLRKYLGINDVRLNLAWNWARMFPRTSPTPGAAAVRRGHVMLLVSHVEGSNWIVRDYNGGRHLSYIHERNVRGYVFVNPSSRLAQAKRSVTQ